MKQIIQDLKTGDTILQEVPVPKIKDGYVLIKAHNSLVSLGTEKMLVSFGKANYIEKARQQPEKVKQVLQKIKTDGLIPTVDAVFRKLGQPLPLGYCHSGEVIGIGKNVKNFKIGDRVASNGSHSEFVNVPENLVAKIPDNVSYEDASFTVLGSIGLQGIRLLNPTFGETIVVIGLGLIGLISAQLLNANGCNVIGFDFDDNKIDLAKKLGIDSYNSSKVSIKDIVKNSTNNAGADGVLITASTKSNSVISDSAKISRQRGRIVLVGVVGLNINRSDMYEKELTFQVSCSYGPGRYSTIYEEKGKDYPIGFVRWTEQRNFQAILKAISDGLLDVKSLITERVSINDYNKIYNNISNNKSIASILQYDTTSENIENVVEIHSNKYDGSKGVICIVGAGNFTSSVVAPNLYKINAKVKSIVSSNGLSGTMIAKKYKISQSSTDFETALKDNNIDAFIITTRHNLHSDQILKALKFNKHVFVEKPLALTISEIEQIEEVFKDSKKSLTVGFNRRFSPFSILAKNEIGDINNPINVIINVNAGFIDQDHWTQDLEVGGGRVVGEACHFIDLISFFTSSKVKSVLMNSMGKNPSINTDNVSILLRYENGSSGVINYFANGNKAYQKERIEIFDNGRNIIIDNFRKISYYGYGKRNKTLTQDKGHYEQFNRWNNFIKNGGEQLIEFKSIVNTSKTAILCLKSLSENKWINIE